MVPIHTKSKSKSKSTVAVAVARRVRAEAMRARGRSRRSSSSSRSSRPVALSRADNAREEEEADDASEKIPITDDFPTTRRELRSRDGNMGTWVTTSCGGKTDDFNIFLQF